MQKPAFYLAAALVVSLLAASAITSFLFLARAQRAREQLSQLERGQALLNRRLAGLAGELRLAEASRTGLASAPARAGSASPTSRAAPASRGGSASAPRAVPLSAAPESPGVSMRGPPPTAEQASASPRETRAAAAYQRATALPAPLPAAPEPDPVPPVRPVTPESARPRPALPEADLALPETDTALPEADLALQRELASGLRCYEEARYGEAAARFAAVLALQPGNARARRYYATCLYRANPGDSGRYAEIERHLRQVLREQPQDAEALEVSGRLRAERECWSDALGFFQRALELRPADAEYARMAGLCALYGGDAGEAEGYFLRVCSLNGKAAEPWHLLGLARERAGRLEEAAAGYLRSLELEPGRLQARLRAGLVLLKLGRYQEAREQLQEHAGSRPGAQGLTALGDCLLALGEAEQAEGCWRRALERMTPFSAQEKRAAAELYLRLCRAAWRRRDLEQSLTLAEQGLLCEPLPLLRAFRQLAAEALEQELP